MAGSPAAPRYISAVAKMFALRAAVQTSSQGAASTGGAARDSQVRRLRTTRSIGARSSPLLIVHALVAAQQVDKHLMPEIEGIKRHALVDTVEHSWEIEVSGKPEGREPVAGDAEQRQRLVIGAS